MQANVETPRLPGWSVPDAEMMRELCGHTGACVSLYVQSHVPGAGSAAAGTWMKSVMPEIAQRLRGRGMEEADVAALLSPLDELAAREKMQAGSSSGLAGVPLAARCDCNSPAVGYASHMDGGGPLSRAAVVRSAARPPAVLRSGAGAKARAVDRVPGGRMPSGSVAGKCPRSLPEFVGIDQPDHTLFRSAAVEEAWSR